jgi:hypothetical protein
MPRPVFVITDAADELVRGRRISAQMVEDLLTISGVPTDEIVRVAEALEQERGFPTKGRLAELVSECVGDGRQAAAVLAALVNLRRERIEPFLRNLKEWQSENPKIADQITEPTFGMIRERLTRLFRDYSVLERLDKAHRLMTLTGNSAEEIEILCDIRPVFDEGRKLVEGLIPLTTLRVEYAKQDDETRVLEVVLSEEMLDELLNKATKAKQKLAVLRDSGNVWVPNGWIEEETPGERR